MTAYGGQKKIIPFQKSLQTEEAQQTEINILNAIISEELDFSTVKGQLHSSDFYTEDHKNIFQAFENLLRKVEPIDILTVTTELKSTRRSNGWDWTPYILSLDANALPIGTTNLDHHIRKIKTYSRKRKLWAYSIDLAKAIEDDDNEKRIKLHSEISDFQIQDARDEVVLLADQKITPRTWVLKGIIPDYYPTIIYGAGGIGKSFVALNLAILTCLGGQKFLDKELPQEPRNVLIVDYELEASEQARRSKQIAEGLNLNNVPSNLYYFEPKESLPKVLPRLKREIKSKDIGFIILDSLGASGTDGESVQDIVSLFNRLRDLGIATLILDHQSKIQMGERYENKTPFGSVYKHNLARSVLQLSKKESKNNKITLQLRHNKSNFGREQGDLIFDVYFEGDRVLLTKSAVKSDRDKEIEIVSDAIIELEEKGDRVNQDAVIGHLQGSMGKDTVVSILKDANGTYWDTQRGDRKELLYKSKNLKSGSLSNTTFGLLESDQDFEIPPELMD